MKQILSISALVFTVLVTGFSQKTIKGQVIDADTKEPLVGANIVIKGTTRGVAADENGQFKLNVLPTDSLTISFIGYTPQDVIPNQNTVSVGLESGVLLNPVSVVGYKIMLCTKVSEMETYVHIATNCVRGGRGCGLGSSVSFRNMNLSAEKIDNQSVTKLSYFINNYSKYKFSDYSIEDFSEKELFYEVYKSTNGIDFKLLGETKSSGKTALKTENKQFRYGKFDEHLSETNYTLMWANSAFFDREIQPETDSTTYRVFAYVIKEYEVENPYNAKYPNREYYASQEIKVANQKTEALKINNLYVERNASTMNVQVTSPKEAETEFVLVNMSGQVLIQQKQGLLKNNNDLNLNINDMPSGTYLLFVAQGQLADKWKFVIVK